MSLFWLNIILIKTFRTSSEYVVSIHFQVVLFAPLPFVKENISTEDLCIHLFYFKDSLCLFWYRNCFLKRLVFPLPSRLQKIEVVIR